MWISKKAWSREANDVWELKREMRQVKRWFAALEAAIEEVEKKSWNCPGHEIDVSWDRRWAILYKMASRQAERADKLERKVEALRDPKEAALDQELSADV